MVLVLALCDCIAARAALGVLLTTCSIIYTGQTWSSAYKRETEPRFELIDGIVVRRIYCEHP